MALPYMMAGPDDLDSSKLLFWPNNPRLRISDFREIQYSSSQLINDRNQKKIWHLLCTNEHEVPKLAKSMIQSGFMREKAPIVLELGKRDRFLVLEGNRRLAAVWMILQSKGKIDPNVKESLRHIPCWRFLHTNKSVPLNAAISRMVAEAHIKGQKPHTKIQQAHMLYDAYMSFLAESGQEDFVKEPGVIKKGAEFFELSEKEFEQEIAVFRLYRQLVDVYPRIDHKIREKLTWVYRNPSQFKNVFGYSKDSFQLGSSSLDAYYDIFIRSGCAVGSPRLFKKFQNIMRYGGKKDIQILQTEPDKLMYLEQSILAARDDERFLKELRSIEQRIGKLKIHEFGDSKEERRTIENIQMLVDKRLTSLIGTCGGGKTVTTTKRRGQVKLPTSVDDVFVMGYSLVSQSIQALLVSRPNVSCVRAKIPTMLLRKWSIRTRGKPRQKLIRHIQKIIDEMAAEGKVVTYKSKNYRVRLPDKY